MDSLLYRLPSSEYQRAPTDGWATDTSVEQSVGGGATVTPTAGFEPAIPKEPVFETGALPDYATSAKKDNCQLDYRERIF